MKTVTFFVFLIIFTVFIMACGGEESSENDKKTGTLKFKTINPVNSKEVVVLKAVTNPKLTGATTEVYTTSMKLAIGDVWVSQGEVKEGVADDLEWIRLTDSTNTEIKLFEDYSFSAKEIPAGTYKSIKIIFRNVFYRYAELISDPSVKYQLLETMGSWEDACDENDESWAGTNYFGPDGNHSIVDGLFKMVSEGEKIGGFTIEAGKTAVVSWRLGAGVTTPCTTYLIDENDNLEWDCGVDRMEFDCPPEAKYMWDFVVEYE
jgi:hypothetical protein